jgi:hypothetical protein
LPDRQSPAIQFTLRSLMLCVAIAALLLYLVRLFGDRVFFGLLPLVSVLIGRGVRRLKPPDHRFSPRDQILVGLLCLAVLSPAIALRLTWMMGPGASVADHIEGFFMLLGAGVAPLAIFLACTLLWRLSDAQPPLRPTEVPDSELDGLPTTHESTRGS